MPVVLLIAGLVIVIAVILVARGRGGELPAERADYAPLDLGPVSATDVALLRPPANAWGYNMQATDEAMAQIAESIRERDVRIVALEQLVTDLSREPAPPPLAAPYIGSRRRALPEGVNPATPVAPQAIEGGAPETAHLGEVTWSAETAWSRELARPSERWPADATRPDLPAWTEESAKPEADAAPEAGHAAEEPPSPGEGQPGPPERSHG